MLAAGHCRHCWGDCVGTCLLPGDQGMCIHNPYPKLTFRQRVAGLAKGRFWQRVLRGL
jgi:hypothetical protein